MKLLLLVVLLVSPFEKIEGYRIVCDYSAWTQQNNLRHESFTAHDLPDKLCTHLNYNYLNISSDFDIMFSSRSDISNFQNVVNLKILNPHLKVMCSIGGWDQGSLIFSIIANSPQSRTKFSKAVFNFIKNHHCDGVNIAWLHPAQRGGIPNDKMSFSLLLQELKAHLSPSGYLLSISGAGIKELIDTGYDVPTISQAVDFVNLMTYDLRGEWDGVTGNPAQLFQKVLLDPPYLRGANQDTIVRYWISQGAEPSKLNLGLQFHGRTFTLINDRMVKSGSPISGAGTPGSLLNDPYLLNYPEICLRKAHPAWMKSSVGQDLQAPFIFGPNQQGKIEWVGYSDVYTMKICSQYVIHMKLGGVSIWAIENDDFSGSYCKQGMYPLLTTLNEELLTVKNKSVENNTSIINSVPETSPKYLKPNKKSPIVQNAISSINIIQFNATYGQCDCELNYDYHGSDIISKYAFSDRDCCDYCYQNTECTSFTYIPSNQACFIKSSSFVRIESPGRISCKPTRPFSSTITTIISTTMKTTTTVETTTTETTTTEPTTTLTTTTLTTTTETISSVNTIEPKTTVSQIDFQNKLSLRTMCSLFQSRINYVGNDLGALFAENIDECCNSCNASIGCNGWSYNSLNKICYFKTHMTNSMVDDNYISGFPSYSSYICRSGKVLMPNLLTSCKSYYACTKDTNEKFRYVILECPSSLVFNKLTDQCDYSNRVICN